MTRRPGHPSRCQQCGGALRWLQSDHGMWVALDAAPSLSGQWSVFRDLAGGELVRLARAGDGERYRLHGCPSPTGASAWHRMPWRKDE